MDETTIFLVDDNATFRREAKRLLETQKDFKVVGQSSNAYEAICEIESLSPDIILVDIKMPGKDGFQLVKSLPGRRRNIIMLSMFDEYKSQAISLGVAGFVSKVEKPTKLIKEIRSARQRWLPPSVRYVS